ncbi:MAG: hypothetical protein JWN40_4800 [Phycisphaerales bacterium]|nr:hypothetical protein [Phycisphaerales bacterium]
MSVKRSLSLALGGALLFPALGWASGLTPAASNSDGLTLAPTAKSSDSATPAANAPNGSAPLYLAMAAEEAPNIHGFANVSFGTSYITPRGLVVENAGVVIQPVAGLVLPIGDIGFLKNYTLVAGVWNSINSAQGDTDVGPWNEMDFFFSMSANVTPEINLNLTYGAWNFPQSSLNKPSTEHNIDLKVSYADKWFGPDFSLNPYIDIFYEIGGSSTVVQGRNGGTGYLEVGIVPTYTLKAIDGWPITLTFPTYFSVGPEEYWGTGANKSGHFGVLSTAVNASVPLKFIPTRYGHWHADFGVQYYNLLNGTLLDSGTILSGNTDRNIFRGYAGFGVGF